MIEPLTQNEIDGADDVAAASARSTQVGGGISFICLPVVQYRHRTGECVAVIPASAGSCENLPQRHEAEWVAPK